MRTIALHMPNARDFVARCQAEVLSVIIMGVYRKADGKCGTDVLHQVNPVFEMHESNDPHHYLLDVPEWLAVHHLTILHLYTVTMRKTVSAEEYIQQIKDRAAETDFDTTYPHAADHLNKVFAEVT